MMGKPRESRLRNEKAIELRVHVAVVVVGVLLVSVGPKHHQHIAKVK